MSAPPCLEQGPAFDIDLDNAGRTGLRHEGRSSIDMARQAGRLR